MWNSHRQFLDIPAFLREAPPSPFFQTRQGEEHQMGSSYHLVRRGEGEFTRRVRTVEDEQDPENYYNDWIMSNLG